ncbi:glycoside hydrolase family 43 protein [uncultured Bacteroides sp.]|uniref:glycoside hydrolase family 43 protein n=1 Tax=uncultured Bacteroides sp. TaxID=162156 RepID=UPI002AABE5F4|nr:glycoside hydrolase family 43 protein [uncultured Bacteroides sp.]
MKNDKLLKSLLALLFSSCVLDVSYSCTSSDHLGTLKPVSQGKAVALFDDFSYKGEDDFYEKTPLPDASSFYNPILPGWYSDPSICRKGDDYFLVTSTFSYFPGVPIFHSKDLMNWRQIGNVLNRPSQLVNMIGQHISGGIFAPAISYNPHNDTYYMITTNVGAGNFFVKTKDPFGEWSDPIWLPDVKGIDPSFFFDDNGKAYIVNNDEPEGEPEYNGHRAIRVQEFDPATDKTFGPRKVLINKGAHPEDKPIWIEGPHMYKINGRYFLMSAEGGTSTWHSEVIFSGDSPMGTFVPWKNNPILTQRHLNPQRPNPITCAGHADLVQTKEGDWWAVFLACRPIDNKFENLGRETFMMPVKWSDDGFPYMTQGDDLVPMLLKREGVKRDKTVTFGNFEVTDDFSSSQLGLEWMTLRTPGTDLYSLSENPGYLTLKCSDVAATEKKTPAFICRRMQHHKFECTTQMLFDPSDDKSSAGLLLFKDETHQYFLAVSKQGDEKCIALEKVGNSANTILASKNFDKEAKAIDLKVVSKGLYYDFYYAVEKGKWLLLSENVDAGYLSTSNANGFTGTTIGMYAVQK